MLKQITSFILAVFMLFLWSCSVREEIFSDLTPENFYRTESDFEKATLGMYNAMNRSNDIWDRDMFTLVQMPSRYFVSRVAARKAFSNFTFGNTDAALDNTWISFYRTINRANAIIDRIVNIQMDAAKKDQYIGEAKFIRALIYFNLVRLWGDVPLILKETTDLSNHQPFRSRSALVYEQVINDIIEAEGKLPDSYPDNTKGRPSAGAAKALLGKVYLTMSWFPLKDEAKLLLARNKLKEVIDSAAAYGYGIGGSYKDVFDVNKEDNQDLIYVIKYMNMVGQGSALAFLSLPLNSNLITAGGQYHYGTTRAFYNLFAASDLRRSVTCLFSYTTMAGGTANYGGPANYRDPNGIALGKYVDGPPGKAPSNVAAANDLPLLRFADVLLMFAEADNELNGPTEAAYTQINRLRTRANVGALSNLTQTTFREAIRRERLFELTGELHEFFDIQRWGTLKEELAADPEAILANTVYKPEFETYPYPITEINVNPNILLPPQ